MKWCIVLRRGQANNDELSSGVAVMARISKLWWDMKLYGVAVLVGLVEYRKGSSW